MNAMRVAVVLGAGRGIGAASAKSLAAKGHHVVVVARTRTEVDDVVRKILDDGDSARGIGADLSDDADYERVIESIRSIESGVNTLVVCAGWARLGASGKVPWYELEAMLRLHLVLPYRATASLRPLLAKRSGRVIVIGSRAGRSPQPHAVAYGTSKAAVAYLVRSLSGDLKPDKISVCAINPGAVDTRLRRDAMGPGTSPGASPESVAEVVSMMAMLENPELTGTVVDLPW
jgi:3-oxoacyl-[acyl-carrier protein] reductase